MSTPPPAAAETVFGDRLPLARCFVDLVAEEGVRRGLIGPRETDRLWDRHMLNCAVLGELIEPGVRVIDVGSGGGFPGVPLAIARPDLVVTLLEPMARRVEWLEFAVDRLGLECAVVRGRAEEKEVRRTLPAGDVVASRAVAPLDRLAGWCLPLTRRGGTVLAMKGARAESEIDEHRAAITRGGGDSPTVLECGRGTLEQPTRVVRINVPQLGRGRKDR